jgi:lipopolysaccharide/colanic/teichoic acid biosynthesis glycosyltransferase
LGRPEQLADILTKLEVHGIAIERIVVTQPFEKLSRRAVDALLKVEQSSDVKVEWITERLGFTQNAPHNAHPSDPKLSRTQGLFVKTEVQAISLGKYGYVKRGFDLLAALLLCVSLAPLILIVGIVVCLDVGLPLVFWQQRPGRFGRPFKLYKFCTMGRSHDAQGWRVPDEQRSSTIGRLLRRTKLDEIPQLYNIVVGDMSLVGPRPLLPTDQPDDSTRLSVRPGLTGYAQVQGGRNLSVEDKNTLDVWYVCNASLWLDLTILLRTLMVLVMGERVNHCAIRAARQGLEHQIRGCTAKPSLMPKSLVGDGPIRIAPSAN